MLVTTLILESFDEPWVDGNILMITKKVRYRSKEKRRVSSIQLTLEHRLLGVLEGLPPGTRSAIVNIVLRDWYLENSKLKGFEIAMKLLSDFNLNKHQI